MTTNRKILLITAGAAIFIFFATSQLIYRPHTRKFKDTLKVLNEEHDKNRIFFEIKRIKDEIDSRGKELLKSEKDLPWLLVKVSEIFNLLGLEVISMEPQPLEKTMYYTLIPIKVKTVSSYHTVGELISKLESLDKFIDISYLELRNLAEADMSAQEETQTSQVKEARLRRTVDSKGFILSEATLKLNAVFLH